VGPDAFTYMKELKAAGIDTARVHTSQLPTASFNVMTDSDDNQIGGFYPGAMSDSKKLSLEPWAGQDVLVCISAHDPAGMRSQVEECKRYGLRLVYDPGQQVSNSPAEDLAAGVKAAEVLIANDYELGVLSEKTGLPVGDIKSRVPVVVTTLGKEGSVIEGAKVKQPIKVPACTPAKVVDPTGAGDAYRAGFLYGYLRQWQLRECGLLGSAVASYIVEHHGTQTRLSRPAIMERYKKTFNEEVEL
jgi:adenosine kinase